VALLVLGLLVELDVFEERHELGVLDHLGHVERRPVGFARDPGIDAHLPRPPAT
jgi:hypothetical protein